ncbi:hypothetical protein U0021_06195 [Moraxella canis]|uniref:Lipoprotein n=1 Tax=Moraxella canis TaxID=90239 RepID=A0ABZ0WWB7_9GAMM|nr:hypothetical protein [Moraxella canis]WQE03359.1 hypothetical protein U0021_06195 [Moraxella canis]
MKFLKITAGVLMASVVLTGCTATKNILSKRDNGSLDYRDEKKLPPIQLPAQQPAAEFTPLYHTPDSVSQLPDFINDSGKQYQLPRPPSVR